MRNSSLKATAVLAVAASSLWATSAQAQTGPWAGVSAGYGWSNAKASTSTVFSATGYFATTSVPAINASGLQTVKPTAADVGIDAGYDVHSGGFLYGVAADVSLLSGSKSRSTTATYPCCAPTAYTIQQTVKTKWMTTVRARLGVDVAPGTALYVTGGYAGLQARYSALFTDTFATANESGFKSEFRSGWVVGGGADIRVGGKWSVQPEYLYADFGHMSATGGTLTAFTPAISFPTNTFTHTTSLRTNIVRLGVHYHF